MLGLQELYQGNAGKVSDKWDLYLTIYDNLFAPYRDLTGLNLLEIGVQNGGSLEIWSRYFPRANRFVGCDINPLCGDLAFDDQRISVLVGDCASEAMRQSIASTCDSFDIVIEDAAHSSDNIIRTFVSIFPLLKPGGVYISEDLHCSYWSDYGGGLNYELSAISFFKRLVDGLNGQSWVGARHSIRSALAPFTERYQLDPDRLELCIRDLSSLEFYDSVCVLRRRQDSVPSRLGKRIVTGSVAAVAPLVQDLQGSSFVSFRQSGDALLSEVERLRLELDLIYGSRSWKLLSWLRNLIRH